MTSEGGGAVAFPVMTLALKVCPTVARDFSLMIQSCGEFDRYSFSIHIIDKAKFSYSASIFICVHHQFEI